MKSRFPWGIAGRIPNQRRLAFLGKIGLSVGILWALKRLAHDLHLDVLKVDPLFIALIFSTLILLSVLLCGVLGDFRESEKLPAEAATNLQMLGFEIFAIASHNHQADTRPYQRSVTALAHAILDWLLAKIPASQLHQAYDQCYQDTVAASVLLQGQPVLQGRLIQKMENLLRIINRIDAIRETAFVVSVYWLAWLGTGLICIGLIFTHLNTPLESSVFMLVVSFVLLYLMLLIADLDNPFGYSDDDSAEDVNLQPLLSCIKRLESAPRLSNR